MMNLTLAQHEIRYPISEDEVCSKASDLLNILVAGGVDPAGLSSDDLVPIAMKMKETEFAYEAIDRGITIDHSHWTRIPGGGAEIVLSFEEVSDAVMFKMWLT
jgi:hypothetical protein